MKTLLFLIIQVTVSAAAVDLRMTNGVPLVGTGLRIFLTDEDGDFLTNGVNDLELQANRTLNWGLHVPTSRPPNSILYLGPSNSFSFELSDMGGKKVPRTSIGDAMNAGPKSFTDVYAAGARRIGPTVMGLPAKLDEMFSFPSNGVYMLEFRYWHWHPVAQKFIRSDPVRVRVVKEGD